MCMKVELYGCNKTLDCTHMIKLNENEKVNIVSPFYPQPYPSGAHCNWLISLPRPDTHVSVIAMDFDVGGGPNCTTEFVKVYNHLYSFSKHLDGTYCSSAQKMMPRVTKKNNQFLRISFDGGNNTFKHRGFNMMIWASNEDVKTAKSCENSTISLDCRNHEKNIEVIHVIYGQYQHSDVCIVNATLPDPPLSKTSCRGPDVLPKLQETCDYRNNCKVAVEKSTFPHDCPNTGPLEMFLVYQCNASEQIHSLPTSSHLFSSTNIISSSSTVLTTLQSDAVVITTPPPPTTTAPPQTTTTLPLTTVIPETTMKPTDHTESHETVKILQTDEKIQLGSSIILIAAVPAAGFMLIIIIAVTIYCVCCKKSRKAEKAEITKMGVVPSESIQSKVMIQSDSLYEKIDDLEREMGKMGRYEASPNTRYSPLHGAQRGMSENPLYQSGDHNSSYDIPTRVRYIGASETSIKITEPSYIDVLKSPEELPANSIPMAKYLEPPHSPLDHTAVITIPDGRYSTPPLSGSLNGEEVYETMTGSVA